MVYKVIFAKQAYKDLNKIKQAGLGRQVKDITMIITINPYQSPPRFEKLMGELQGYLSRRINIQHRYIYQVLPNYEHLKDEHDNIYDGIIHVLRMWTHYE